MGSPKKRFLNRILSGVPRCSPRIPINLDVRGVALGVDLYDGFDLDRQIEWQLRHPDRAARVGAPVRPEQLEDQIGEAVDHERLLVESGCRVDHAEHARPGADSIEIAELALEVAEDRESHKSRRLVTLLD